ncbi:cyclin-D2-2-like [Zingiber officinale]|uniref:cyclin-D2-2-like n=1 Tax=Zingiber officinale TaxID=94328 RepID=UPI001C4BFB7C|nr:cyclin-D2-2-like [Zingiber officinale]
MVSRCTEIILNTVRAIDMMEFWPFEVAASTALLVLGDAKVVDVVENFPHCSLVSKRKVWQCYGVIQYLEMARQRDHLRQAPASSPVLKSPVGVLDHANLSIKSDDPIADQSHKTSVCKRKASRLTCPFIKRRRISRL